MPFLCLSWKTCQGGTPGLDVPWQGERRRRKRLTQSKSGCVRPHTAPCSAGCASQGCAWSRFILHRGMCIPGLAPPTSMGSAPRGCAEGSAAGRAGVPELWPGEERGVWGGSLPVPCLPAGPAGAQCPPAGASRAAGSAAGQMCRRCGGMLGRRRSASPHPLHECSELGGGSALPVMGMRAVRCYRPPDGGFLSPLHPHPAHCRFFLANLRTTLSYSVFPSHSLLCSRKGCRTGTGLLGTV